MKFESRGLFDWHYQMVGRNFLFLIQYINISKSGPHFLSLHWCKFGSRTVYFLKLLTVFQTIEPPTQPIHRQCWPHCKLTFTIITSMSCQDCGLVFVINEIYDVVLSGDGTKTGCYVSVNGRTVLPQCKKPRHTITLLMDYVVHGLAKISLQCQHVGGIQQTFVW